MGRTDGAGASTAPTFEANEAAAVKCPICTADRDVDETAQMIYGRAARAGDYFVCVCSTVLVITGGCLIEPTAVDLWNLHPHEFAILWHARKRAAYQLRRVQGGRV